MIGAVLFYLAFWPGMLFFVYWPTQYFLLDFARHQTKYPGVLYYRACVLLFPAAIATPILLVTVALTLGWLLGELAVVIWCVPGAGWIGWVVLWARRSAMAAERLTYRRQRPLPRLQCYLSEVLVTVLVFGFVMALLSTRFDDAVWGVTCYLLLAMGLGFLVGLDILRRMPVSVRPAVRAATLAGVMLWFAVSAVIGGLIAWAAWRSALTAAEIEEWTRTSSGSTATCGNDPATPT